MSTLSTPRCGHFVFVYADDIILLAPSVAELERLLHISEKGLEWLDMSINFKNRVALESTEGRMY